MPPAGLKRGGSRNSRDRVSWQLSHRQCSLIVERTLDAWECGLPMSRFITLAWGLAGINAEQAVAMTGAFISKAREWMRHHGSAMPWVWVQECGDTFGQHAHVLLHVPSDLAELFRPMPVRWVKALIDGPYTRGTVQTQRLRAARIADANPWQYRAELLGKLNYMLKCAPAELEEELGLLGYGHKPWDQRTRVVGKRAGAWQQSRVGGGGEIPLPFLRSGGPAEAM